MRAQSITPHPSIVPTSGFRREEGKISTDGGYSTTTTD